MIEIYSAADLDGLLAELRVIGADHQWVEAKAARTEVPATLWQSVVALANTDVGGLVLLGVDEGAGEFRVTGVENPGRVEAGLGAVCAELDPPLRPSIHSIVHAEGVVIVARIVPVPRNHRPCHRSGDIYGTSYIRVGDRDDKMTSMEVDDLRANRVGSDHSRRPAPDGARLDPAGTGALLERDRELYERHRDLGDEQLLRVLGAVDDDGHPTLAALLSVGEEPQRLSAAARVSYRVAPAVGDPAGTRFTNARHLEGTVGEILDDTLSTIRRDLRRATVVGVDGQLVDSYDVSTEALREVLSNALTHRSLAPGQDSTSAVVEVGEQYVTVTNPGGVHVDVDPRMLGLTPMSTPRNITLVRLCERLSTPSGNRITEGQASGILAADRDCRATGTAPALFATKPARFVALLLRGRLAVEPVLDLWRKQGVELTADEGRVLAFAERLAELHAEDAGSDFSQVQLDAALVARVLAPMVQERAIGVLAHLESLGALASRRWPDRVIWVPVPPGGGQPAAQDMPQISSGKRGRRGRKDQVQIVLVAIKDSVEGQLRLGEIQTALGVSRQTANVVVKHAVAEDLIEATSDVAHDPTRAYRLTRTGTASAERA